MAYVEPIKVKKADVARIIAATFPDYRGQKISVRPATSESLQDLNWSGGSRSQYRACTLDGRALGTSAEYHTYAPWDNRQVEGQSVPIPPGSVMVRHSIFCGKDTGLTITCHPDDMPKLLPAPR
jgi:hypothetical protein